MEGIVGKGYTLSAQQDGNDRESTIAYNLTKYLLDTRFRERADEETPIHLFPQVKRIVRRWLKEHFSVAGGIKPSAVFTLQRIRDEVRDILYRGITTDGEQQPSIKPMLDPFNPSGSTRYVGFNSSQEHWITNPGKCHVNACVLDSDWEGECCRAIEDHPAVRGYVKNHNLGFEVPYHHDGVQRTYIPDFIVQVDDGRGEEDLLNLIIEIKGYRGEDARAKAETMRTLWLPAVNNAQVHGRWAFAEFTEPYEIADRFRAVIDDAINQTEAR